MDIDKKLFGMGLLRPAAPSPNSVLRERFLIPPFSVLNARDGVWQERKRRWLALGIEGEVGRGNNLLDRSAAVAGALGKLDLNDPEAVEAWNAARRQGRRVNPGGSPMPSAQYSNDGSRGDGRGKPIQAQGRKEKLSIHGGDSEASQKIEVAGSTTSIFDPVLCEALYRWFCPLGGQVVDPFAGGSVRGIVAHVLGMKYWGCDLRPEQIEANRAQAQLICPDNQPTWVVGDAREVMPEAPRADFTLACPPYGDLEKYSNNPADLSNMGLREFRQAYTRIIELTCRQLKEDRFACFVVGDYRDKDGNYCNLPGGTIRAFEKAGLHLYNEAILVTAVSSLSLRVGGFFEKSRKLGKGHQNVLCFVNGNARRATDYIKECQDGKVQEG